MKDCKNRCPPNKCTCSKKVSSDDVYYSGNYLPNMGILPNTNLTTILKVIDSFIGSSGGYMPNEIIELVDTSSITIDWNSVRKAKFGEAPVIDLYTLDSDTNLYTKTSTYYTTNSAPPNITEITITFTSNVSGYLIIT